MITLFLVKYGFARFMDGGVDFCVSTSPHLVLAQSPSIYKNTTMYPSHHSQNASACPVLEYTQACGTSIVAAPT